MKTFKQYILESKRPTENSLGKPIASTPEAIENFWKWFSNSKVVDEQGKPMVVYHGTNANIEAFDVEKAKSEGKAFYFVEQHKLLASGNQAELAGKYAKIGNKKTNASIYPVYLQMKNPLYLGVDEKYIVNPDRDITAGKFSADQFLDAIDKFNRSIDYDKTHYVEQAIKNAKRMGNDGVIIRGMEDDPGIVAYPNAANIYISFSPSQIKSATGNNGNFSPNSNKISESIFESYLTEQMMGININDDSNPWTDWILSGKKTIETRNKPTLNAYIGKRVGIIKTGKRNKATLVGYATIGEPIKYESPEQFNKDYKKHRVEPDNALYNGGIKYGYPLTDVESVEPKPVNTKGIISRRLEEYHE